MRVLAVPLLASSLITTMAPEPPPVSGFMTVSRLLEHCDPAENSEAGMGDICVGYIAGSMDQIVAKQSTLPPSKRRVCLPAALTIGDVKDVLVAHLRDMPDDGDAAAAFVVERIAAAQFPC
jgi:hypothetical protein